TTEAQAGRTAAAADTAVVTAGVAAIAGPEAHRRQAPVGDVVFYEAAHAGQLLKVRARERDAGRRQPLDPDVLAAAVHGLQALVGPVGRPVCSGGLDDHGAGHVVEVVVHQAAVVGCLHAARPAEVVVLEQRDAEAAGDAQRRDVVVLHPQGLKLAQ